MTTETLEQPTALATKGKPVVGTLYTVTEATIEAKRAELMALRINGINDEKGIATVKAAKRDVVKWRTSVEKTREDLKREHLAAGRKIDSEAKEIQALIAPIEQHLADEIEAVEKELARIAKLKEDELYAKRVQRLTAVCATLPEAQVREMSEPVFEVALENAATEARLKREADERAAAEKAEQERLLAEQAEANRVEQERLAAERAELARQKAEQDAEAARLKKIEDDKLAAERAELKRQQEALQAEKDRLAKEEADRVAAAQAEEKRLAKIEQEKEAERLRLAREQEKAAELAAAELRAEQLKPVKEKVEEFANKVRLLVPPLVGDELTEQINAELAACADRIAAIAKGLK